MVFLTAFSAARALMGRPIPGPDRFWRRQMYFRLAWHMFGRKRNCFSLTIRYVRRALMQSHRYKTSGLQARNVKAIMDTRIHAACMEHGLTGETFQAGLKLADIALNRKVLEDLAIYEPRTFQSLCQFVEQEYNDESYEMPAHLLTSELLDKVKFKPTKI